jgi:excisionase family DNA binding protein
VTVTQLAAAAGVSPQYVRRLILRRRIPASYDGLKWQIDEEDAARWLRSRGVFL